MDKASRDETWERAELLQLFAASTNLSGLCITAVTLLRTVGQASAPQTVADDLLAVCALLFMLCSLGIFVGLRTRRAGLASLLKKASDVLFLLALSGMVASGFIMVYTLM